MAQQLIDGPNPADEFAFERILTQSDRMDGQTQWIIIATMALSLVTMMVNLNLLEHADIKYQSLTIAVQINLALKIFLSVTVFLALILIEYMMETHVALYGRLDYLIRNRNHEKSKVWVESGLHVINGHADDKYFKADRYRAVQTFVYRLFYFAMLGGVVLTFLIGLFTSVSKASTA